MQLKAVSGLRVWYKAELGGTIERKGPRANDPLFLHAQVALQPE